MRFYDVRDAEDAMMALNGRKFDGRPLRIQFARYGRVGSPSDRLGGWDWDPFMLVLSRTDDFFARFVFYLLSIFVHFQS